MHKANTGLLDFHMVVLG